MKNWRRGRKISRISFLCCFLERDDKFLKDTLRKKFEEMEKENFMKGVFVLHSGEKLEKSGDKLKNSMSGVFVLIPGER